jgi:hypothetical protein
LPAIALGQGIGSNEAKTRMISGENQARKNTFIPHRNRIVIIFLRNAVLSGFAAPTGLSGFTPTARFYAYLTADFPRRCP